MMRRSSLDMATQEYGHGGWHSMDRTTYSVIPFTHSHLHTVEHRAHNDACLVAVEEMVTVSAHQQAGKKLLFLDDTAGDEHSVAVEGA